MDKTLLAIARTAEQGGQVPFVQLLTGNFLVVGQPVSQEAFAEAWARAGAAADLRASHPRRKERDALWREIYTKAEAILEPVRQSFTDQLDAICFAPARAVFMSTAEAE